MSLWKPRAGQGQHAGPSRTQEPSLQKESLDKAIYISYSHCSHGLHLPCYTRRWGPEVPWKPCYGAWASSPPLPPTPQLSLQSGNQGGFKSIPVDTDAIPICTQTAKGVERDSRIMVPTLTPTNSPPPGISLYPLCYDPFSLCWSRPSDRKVPPCLPLTTIGQS